MAWEDPLRTNLLDLLFELRSHTVPLTIGGGFGLYLKRLHLDQTRERTLFSALPMPRATNDLDLFIRADVLCELDRVQQLADALQRLKYEVIEEAKYMQWKKGILLYGEEKEIKVDLLVGPLGDFRNRLHVKGPRVRPAGDIKLHAHTAEEALELDTTSVEVSIAGKLSSGEDYQASIRVPQAFTYLMMKLTAFDDQKEDPDKKLGRHHALDVYAIAAMMTEAEYRQALELGKQFRDDARAKRVRKIVAEDFAEGSNIGMLRLREHTLFRADFQLADFTSVLFEIFVIGSS